MREIVLNIAGIGVILYSPAAVAHIPEDMDYLQSHFSEPVDVARHVMDGQLIGFCTGSPGCFQLRFLDGPPDDEKVQNSDFKLRLALQVHGGVVCVRDLYDLLQWTAACPLDQQLPVSDGWYRLTVYSSPPPSGIHGDSQVINISLESVEGKPQLHWEGVPSLC